MAGKIKIRFLDSAPESHTLIGNIYPGKMATLNAATAQKFIDLGYAEEIDGEIPAEKPKDKDKDAEQELTLESAIQHLDPARDEHWTKSGLPDLNVLKELTGKEVKRKDVEEVAPDFTREQAAER